MDDVEPPGPKAGVNRQSKASLFEQVRTPRSEPSRGDIGAVKVRDAMTALVRSACALEKVHLEVGCRTIQLTKQGLGPSLEASTYSSQARRYQCDPHNAQRVLAPAALAQEHAFRAFAIRRFTAFQQRDIVWLGDAIQARRTWSRHRK
jgi:hypothetical protein